MRLTVLGAGAWGTALAVAYARGATQQVTLWGRDAAHMQKLAQDRENRRYLAGAALPEALQLSHDLDAAIADADLVLLVTPMSGFRALAGVLLREDKPFLWACKGFEQHTGLLPHQILDSLSPRSDCFGVLAGPSFAREVAANLPAALTLASKNESFAKATASALHQSHLRLYPSTDVIGVEVGAAVKNVLAIATGVVDGLHLGGNARAALLTRGLAEMARLAACLGGKPETLLGLSGVGDLVLTCTGDLSRNRRVGLALAAGKVLPEILADLGHVAEGVATAVEVLNLAKRFQIDMPITACVAAVLRGELSVQAAVQILLEREPRLSE